MKKIMLLAVFILGTMSISSEEPGSEDLMSSIFDFTLINNTGFTIEQVYITPSDDEEWGDDVMGEDVLPDGESVNITFPPEYENYLLDMGYAAFDFLIIDEDGDEYEYYDFALEDVSEITLKLDKKGKGIASWK